MEQRPEINPSIASVSPTPASTQISTSGAPIKRRAPIACRRCRRMRSKCIHDRSNSPCQGCIEAGKPDDCFYPGRGESTEDRQFRHPRQRVDKKPNGRPLSFYPGHGESIEDGQFRHSRQRVDKKSNGKLPRMNKETAVSPCLTTRSNTLDWDDELSFLKDVEMVKEGVRDFTSHFFQLGFIAKDDFLVHVEEPGRISPFLLVSILSISTRFKRNYEDAQKAVSSYLECAQKLALRELYLQPVTLERCQAFFLLSIAQHGMGQTSISNINMGIAISMATDMRLHREDTYRELTESSSREQVVQAESARRTLWMLHSQDNLHSGPNKPVLLAASEITALLPCNEEEFRAGKYQIKPRAALVGTQPANQDPALTILEERSLFATLIQTHHIWGMVARRAVAKEKSYHPGDTGSDYARIARQLDDFEGNLPENHRFQKILLPWYRENKEDLAYLSACATLRLSNIVLRKAYLEDMIKSFTNQESCPKQQIHRNIAHELFNNVWQLYDQITAQFSAKRPWEEMVGSQMAAFCVYSCGLLASYLTKFPNLCKSRHSDHTPEAVCEETMRILEKAQAIWPLASDWLSGLKKWIDSPSTSRVYEGVSMTYGKDPPPHAFLHPPVTTPADMMTGLLSPSFYHNKVESKPQFEPALLPPLQSSQSTPVKHPSLPPPPLTGYISPSQHQPPQFQSPYSNSSSSSLPLQMLDFSKNHQQQQQHHHQPYENMYALHQVGGSGQQHHATSDAQVSTPQVGVDTYEQNHAFMQDYSFGPTNDGYVFHLQQFMDTPAWTVADPQPPGYNHHPQHQQLADMSAQPQI